MRSSIFAALVLLGTLSAKAQTAVEMNSVLSGAFAFSSAVFTDDGNHLIVGVGESLKVFESATGKHIFQIPFVRDKEESAAQRSPINGNMPTPLHLKTAFEENH